MKNACCAALAIGMVAGLLGCSRSASTGSAQDSAGTKPAPPTLAIPGDSPRGEGPASAETAASEPSVQAQTPVQSGTPAAAVRDYLEAVRKGNDEQTLQMLTPIARQKVAERHLNVAPPCQDTARFDIADVENVGDDGARVRVRWTALEGAGEQKTYETLWMVRKGSEGWRIAGVALPVFEGKPLVVLNFEDPDDMLRKRQEVRDEERRLAEEAAKSVPEPPGITEKGTQSSPTGPVEPEKPRQP